MRTADPVQLVCRTSSGSTYTVRPDGSVSGPRSGTLVTAGRPARPAVGGRLLIETPEGVVVTSELVGVDVDAVAARPR